MVRHPNNSGLQRDQVTLLYIPAHFVDELSVWQGDALLFSMVGGISISEDPNFRFDFIPERRRGIPRRRQGYRRQAVPAGVAGDRDVALRQKQRTSASACARRRSLSAVLACSVVRNCAPRSPVICAMLSNGLGRDVALVGQHRGDDVDRAGALLERAPRVAIRLHAGEDVVGARDGRIVVEILRGQRPGRDRQRHARTIREHGSACVASLPVLVDQAHI